MGYNQIGIFTFQNADNYGAVLQNYGLQKAVLTLGYEVETIDYRCNEIDNTYKISIIPDRNMPLVQGVKNLIIKTVNLPMSLKRKKQFAAFRKGYLRLSSPVYHEELGKLSADYSLFITGSDQVWNVGIIKDANVDAFTLSFAEGCKKASYAASAGANECMSEAVLTAIRQLDYTSVREKSLKDYLVGKGIQDIRLVCDPVFLLTKEEWLQHLNINSFTGNSYAFLYYIDENCKNVCDIAKYIADKRKLSMVFPTPLGKNTLGMGKSAYTYGPIEFVSGIAGASIVVASSFHAVVFSIIMEKEFVVVLHSITGSRILDLLETLGLKERIVSDLNDYVCSHINWKPIDYNEVKQKLAEIRTNSLEALSEICHLTKQK